MKLSSKNFKNMAWTFVRDESGQSTTEYVLLLLFVVVAVKSAGTQLKSRINKLLGDAFGKADEAVSSAPTD